MLLIFEAAAKNKKDTTGFSCASSQCSKPLMPQLGGHYEKSLCGSQVKVLMRIAIETERGCARSVSRSRVAMAAAGLRHSRAPQMPEQILI
jgi:hypothetical protein